MKVQVNKLTVLRSGRVVIKGITFSVGAGESMVIVGPNGAGKSTLLQAMLGLLPAADGQVRLGERPVRRWSRRALARQVAYVPQLYEGYLGFTVRQVVETGRYAHLPPLARAGQNDLAVVEQAMSDCDVELLGDRVVGQLSGGERQKVWIAAALAQEAPALWLDEPTQSLDPRHQRDLIRLMRRQQEQGRTLIVVTHDLNLAAWLGCRVLAVKDGQLVFDGPAEELAEPTRLEAIFDAAFLVSERQAGMRPVITLRVN